MMKCSSLRTRSLKCHCVCNTINYWDHNPVHRHYFHLHKATIWNEMLQSFIVLLVVEDGTNVAGSPRHEQWGTMWNCDVTWLYYDLSPRKKWNLTLDFHILFCIVCAVKWILCTVKLFWGGQRHEPSQTACVSAAPCNCSSDTALFWMPCVFNSLFGPIWSTGLTQTGSEGTWKRPDVCALWSDTSLQRRTMTPAVEMQWLTRMEAKPSFHILRLCLRWI